MIKLVGAVLVSMAFLAAGYGGPSHPPLRAKESSDLTPVSLSIADAARAKRFSTYITCGRPHHHDVVCFGGDQPYAVLRAFRRANLSYRICVRRPNGSHKCRQRRTGRPGERSMVAIAASELGVYTVIWKIQGKTIDRDHYRLLSEGV
jgi:hypothetical protein